MSSRCVGGKTTWLALLSTHRSIGAPPGLPCPTDLVCRAHVVTPSVQNYCLKCPPSYAARVRNRSHSRRATTADIVLWPRAAAAAAATAGDLRPPRWRRAAGSPPRRSPPRRPPNATAAWRRFRRRRPPPRSRRRPRRHRHFAWRCGGGGDMLGRAGGCDDGGGGKGGVCVPAPLWFLVLRACGALLVVAGTVHGLFNPCWRRWRLSMGFWDRSCFGSPSVVRGVLVHCMHLLSQGTYALYLRTAARTNQRHMSPVTCSSLELIVSIGQAFKWSGLDHRFSRQLPTEKIS